MQSGRASDAEHRLPTPGAAAKDDAEAATIARAAHPELARGIYETLRVLRLAAGANEPPHHVPGLGRLQLRGRLASGGMATVYRAHDPLLDRDVAVKVLPRSLADPPGANERFRREARALARIRHPHIVAIHDVGESQEALWFTMDLIEGESLHAILARHAGAGTSALQAADLGPTATTATATLARTDTAGSYVEAVTRLTIKVAGALDYAHREGLVHRDVKPGNIMVDGNGEPHLVDFGLARGDDAATVTRSGIGPGTPAYMAPEQIAGRQQVGPRTDVYALGVTLYEALTLRRPFGGDTTERVFHAVLTSQPSPPRRFNPQIPRDLETVCLTAMDKDPARRYATAAAFAEDLRNLLNLRPIQARPAGPLTRTHRLLLRHPAPSAAAVALAIAGAVFGGMSLVRAAGARADLRRHLASAREALTAGDVPAAQQAVARATVLDSEDVQVRELGDVVRAAAAAAAHAQALKDARVELTAFQETVAAIVASRQRAADLRDAVLLARAPLADPLAWPREEERTHQLVVKAETHMVAASEALTRAERHVSGRPEVQAGLAELYLARWRTAISADDQAVAEAYEAKVKEHDHERRHQAELAGEGTLTVEGSPPGARIHLFRHELHSRLRPDAEPRLVPVPFHPSRGQIQLPTATEPSPLGPGEVVLAVEAVGKGSAAAAAGVEPRDLVATLAGARVHEAVWVLDVEAAGTAARAGVTRLDRLIRLGDQEVRQEYDAESAHARLPPGTEYDAVFSSAGGERTVTARRGSSFGAELGVRVGNAAEAAAGPVPEAGLELGVIAGGALRRMMLTPGRDIGLAGVLTAYPLLFTPDNVLGEVPLDPVRMPPGSYLLVLVRPGHHDLRLPLNLGRGMVTWMRADLLPEGATPAGFQYVAPGPSIYGGDPHAQGAGERRETQLPGFFIARAEVTQAEYAEFLNAEATRQRLDGRSLVPRDFEGRLLWRVVAGRYEPDGDPRRPVHDITGVDAQDFVEWRNAEARRRGEPWEYDLPTTEQWEKAARGADARFFPWGNAFAWTFCSSQPARSEFGLSEPVLRFLADESPYGVRDLAGGVLEWLAFGKKLDRTHNLDRTEWRGGGWMSSDARMFRAASRGDGDPNRIGWNDGFRLVARPARR